MTPQGLNQQNPEFGKLSWINDSMFLASEVKGEGGWGGRRGGAVGLRKSELGERMDSGVQVWGGVAVG